MRWDGDEPAAHRLESRALKPTPTTFGAPDHPAAGGLQRAPVEAVVALMDAVDGWLHSTAQILLPRVQGGV